MKPICPIEGCQRNIKTAGLCKTHYERKRRNGDLTLRTKYGMDPVERFWSRVTKTETCWLWDKPNPKYGQFSTGGGIKVRKMIGAHVYSYILENGPVPTGLQVNHRCGVAHCVRPDHLYAGTQAENNRDTVKHGHHVAHLRKLTTEQVIEIRNKYQSGNFTQEALAQQYNTRQSNISEIIRRKTWKSIA